MDETTQAAMSVDMYQKRMAMPEMTAEQKINAAVQYLAGQLSQGGYGLISGLCGGSSNEVLDNEIAALKDFVKGRLKKLLEK